MLPGIYMKALSALEDILYIYPHLFRLMSDLTVSGKLRMHIFFIFWLDGCLQFWNGRISHFLQCRSWFGLLTEIPYV